MTSCPPWTRGTPTSANPREQVGDVSSPRDVPAATVAERHLVTQCAGRDGGNIPSDAECSCAMTESSFRACAVHGEKSSEETLAAWEARQRGDNAPSDRPWTVRLICCGRDAGAESFATWREADAFRESWTSGPAVEEHGYSAPEHAPGHKRAGIIERADNVPSVEEPGYRTAQAGAPMTHERLYPDLDHAIRHAAPDEPTEDAAGYVTWNGKSPNAWNSAETEDDL